jgi:hypothetical protein
MSASDRKAAFVRSLDSTFKIQCKEMESIDLKLIEVSDSIDKQISEETGQVCFSLVLLTQYPTLLPQGTYPVDHEQLGRMDLFIVPIRKDARGTCYEAVFNLLGEKQR